LTKNMVRITERLIEREIDYNTIQYKKDDLWIAVDRKLSQGRFDKNKVSGLWLSVAFSKQIRFKLSFER